MIHAASADRIVSSYDLKSERKIASFQLKNGQLVCMTQRRDNGELITGGAGNPITFWSNIPG